MTPSPVRHRQQPKQRWWVNIPYVLVLLFIAAGLVLVAFWDFRIGVVSLAAATGVAFTFRLILPSKRAGLLEVRSKLTDLLVSGALTGALLILALWVPAPS